MHQFKLHVIAILAMFATHPKNYVRKSFYIN